MFTLSSTPLIFPSGIETYTEQFQGHEIIQNLRIACMREKYFRSNPLLHTLYWNFTSSPVLEYVMMGLSLQKATLSVDTNSTPAMAPAVVYKQH